MFDFPEYTYEHQVVSDVPRSAAAEAVVLARASAVTSNEDTAAPKTTPFFIYSSKAGKSDSDDVKVLGESEAALNGFLDLLPTQGIEFARPAPSPPPVPDEGGAPASTSSTEAESISIQVATDDAWTKWMSWWDKEGVLSATVDTLKDMNIQYFDFEFTAPWPMVFSSRPSALLYAFGATETTKARVPPPGIDPKDNSPLYFGLDMEKTDTITSTIAGVYDFADRPGLAKMRFHDAILGLGVTLEAPSGEALERPPRNAMWFEPQSDLKTTVRLEFRIDAADALEAMFKDTVKTLHFDKSGLARVWATRQLVLADTNRGVVAVGKGQVGFEIACTVGEGADALEAELHIEPFETGYKLTFVPRTKNALQQAFRALTTMTAAKIGLEGAASVLDIEGVFRDHVFLQQFRIVVDVGDEGKWSVDEVAVQLEVSGRFGNKKTEQRAPFLVTHTWTKEEGGIGTLRGEFWNAYNNKPNRVLGIAYDRKDDLIPFTEDPVESLDLLTLIPGVTVANPPANIPRELKRAAIELSRKHFLIEATVATERLDQKDTGDVPQLFLGEVKFDASWAWGGKEEKETKEEKDKEQEKEAEKKNEEDKEQEKEAQKKKEEETAKEKKKETEKTEKTRLYFTENKDEGNSEESEAQKDKEDEEKEDEEEEDPDNKDDKAKKGVDIKAYVSVFLAPGKNSKHKGRAWLKGSVQYQSESKKWTLEAKIAGLYASVLHEFFDPQAAAQITPMLDSIAINELSLKYTYGKVEDEPDEEKDSKYRIEEVEEDTKKDTARVADEAAGDGTTIAKNEPTEKQKVSYASDFTIHGSLYIATLELSLDFHRKTGEDWEFKAKLAAQEKEGTTLGAIIRCILGEDEDEPSQLDIPDFLAETKFEKDDKLALEISRANDDDDDSKKDGKEEEEEKPAAADGKKEEDKKKPTTIRFLVTLTFGKLTLTFAQFHRSVWPEGSPSKRLIKAAFHPNKMGIDVPLVGSVEQPFDELAVLWVQDGVRAKGESEKTEKDPAPAAEPAVPYEQTAPGLARSDIMMLNGILGDHPLVYQDKVKEKKPHDTLVSAGSHFVVAIAGPDKKKTCLLDYGFKKQKKDDDDKTKKIDTDKKDNKPEAETSVAKKEEEAAADLGSSASAPYKKKAGPLSIENIGLRYADKTLHIMLDATFDMGPVAMSLLGFSIDLNVSSGLANALVSPGFSLEGMAVALDKPPLTIAGIFRHTIIDLTDASGKSLGTVECYAGGLVIGWVPYQLQAAGFYGAVTPTAGPGKLPKDPFSSVFVLARLDGPLATVGVASISGVTGGFGYNSGMHAPTAQTAIDFPFIAPGAMDVGGGAGAIVKSLQKLIDPGAGGWFFPENNVYWAAVGMKISAFEMLSLSAVVVVQFGSGTALRLGVYGVAVVDVPTTLAPKKFAHVELGIAATIDFDRGVFITEAELSPRSFVLHPDCHITGGFAMCSWFDVGPSTEDPARVGDFVLTLGGYHRAFQVPKGYPNPDRLKVSWSVGSALSISGEAYFAMTPKACMGGARLHAAFSAGPVSAWFDAFADFLINYKPFNFVAAVGVCVGVGFDLDILFVHIHISVEVSAELTLWGPPLAGIVRVNIKVCKFDIPFGDQRAGPASVSLEDFYRLALQTTDAASNIKTAAIEASRITEVDDDFEFDDAYKPKGALKEMPVGEAHTFLATSGLVNDSADPSRKEGAAWVVRGGPFEFVVGCKMAVASARVGGYAKGDLGSPSAPYAKPMKEQSPLDSTVRVNVVKIQNGKRIPITGWGVEAEEKAMPTGLWGRYDASQDPLVGGNNLSSLLSPADATVKLLTGVRLRAPPPLLSSVCLPIHDVVDSNISDLFAVKPLPDTIDASDKWLADPETLQKDPNKPDPKLWADVRNSWKTPDADRRKDGDRIEEGVQAAFARGWAHAFRWDEKDLVACARMPAGVHKRFDDLYVAVPAMTARKTPEDTLMPTAAAA